MTKVQIYTDGSARGNPDGPGGYGVVLHFTDSSGKLHEKTISEGFVKTTNNRMELLAAIMGLEALNRPCQVELYSDSKYLIDAFNQKWIEQLGSPQLEQRKIRTCKKCRLVEAAFKSQGTPSGAVCLGKRPCGPSGK